MSDPRPVTRDPTPTTEAAKERLRARARARKRRRSSLVRPLVCRDIAMSLSPAFFVLEVRKFDEKASIDKNENTATAR